MDARRLDLGVVSAVHAHAFGEPGQRTFRLLVETPEGQVSLWLEKEQMVMVGDAVSEVLRRTSESHGVVPESSVSRSFVGELEVRVGSLAIGYDHDHTAYSIEASDFVSPFEISSIILLAARSDFERLGEEIIEIVAGSRPRCQLCGTALTKQGHFCPPSNGHASPRNSE